MPPDLRSRSPALAFADFQKEFVAAYTEKSKEIVEERVKTFVIHLTEGLGRRRRIKAVGTDLTPIDTGVARSNWKITLGVPDLSVSKPHIPANPAAIVNNYKAGGTVRITNNTRHIGLLNSPRTPSKQAAPGFIERNIQRAAVIAKLRFKV